MDWPKKLTSKLTERERDLLALLQVAAAFLAYVCISVYIDIYDTMSRVVWWVWVVGVPLFDFSRAKTIIRRILHASGSRRL